MLPRLYPLHHIAFRLAPLAALLAALFSPRAQAASFDIAPGVTVGRQVLSGNNATGVIQPGGGIKTMNFNESGVEVSMAGTGVNIVNGGSIVTTGAGAMGILVAGSNVFISNSGTISTEGNNAYGIGWANWVSNAVVISSGSISTEGANAFAIYSSGDNATITHSGTISTKGNTATGIYSSGVNAVIAHSGTITVIGANAIGVAFSGGGNSTLHLSGHISATGAATQAIAGGAGNETLNLYPNAKIIGSIDLGGGANTLNFIGAQSSSTLSIRSTGGALTVGGSPGPRLLGGGTVAVVDATNLTASQATLGNLSANVFQSVNAQLNSPVAMRSPVKVASNGSDAGIWANDTRPMAWGRVFGKYTVQDSHGAALGFTDHSYGVIGGFEQSLGDHRAGFFGGVSQSRTDVEDDAADLNSDGLFAGVYGQYVYGHWRLNGALALGYANFDSDRQVTDNVYGVENASADYHGWYVSPSLALMHVFDQGAGLSLRPSVEVNYTYGRQGSYTESGTTRSNLSVGSRTAQVLNTRLQLAARQDLIDRKGEVELRGGLSHTHYGSDTTNISLQGVGTTHYSLTGTGDLTGAYVGLNTRYHYKNNINLVGDIEVFNSDGMDFSIMAYAGMEYRF